MVVVGDVLTVRPLPAREVLKLGRDKQCDVRIESGSVSRYHALLYLRPRLAIEDLGSRNGTFVAEKTPGGEGTQPFRRLQREKIELSVGERVNLGIVTTIVVRRTAAAADDAVVLDPAMKALQADLRRAAQGQISILLQGETGVGKEVFARQVHAASKRASGPFVALDCASLPPSLVEDQLVGHERNAFTGATGGRPGYFEAAHGGTLFLDEVGELPLELQVKFLRVLEERTVTRLGSEKPRPVDVRIIAATNRDLRSEVERGTFRRDLLHRLDAYPVEIPPLRRRPAEIEALAERFILRFSRMLDREPPQLAPETLAMLRGYTWAGNVRELRNAMERAVTLCQGDLVLPEDLPPHVSTARQQEPPPRPQGAPPTERERMVRALESCAFNQTRAAAALEMPLRTFVNKLRKYGLPRPRKPRD